MAGKIRVLDSANRTMQRLGYLKILCSLVNSTETTNLESLGKRLVSQATQRTKLSPPFDEDLRGYAKTRLTDGIYKDLRKTIIENTRIAGIELQDIYLADKSLPSSTGKLVEADWRHYPYLGTALELVKKGTYSSMTRSLVLLAVTPKDELNAFNELDRNHNPLRISDSQAMVFLYCLIDNDAEVLLRLFRELIDFKDEVFDERQASDLFPRILRDIESSHRNRSLTAEQRDRLAVLEKVAKSIEKWAGKSYTGGGAREAAIRVRLEPFCDLGLLSKPERDRYVYKTGESLRTFINNLVNVSVPETFLEERFFSTFAACRGLKVVQATVANATDALLYAGEQLKSSLGFTPITDVGLLAGIRLLTEKGCILELNRTTELLKSLQKEQPGLVRFTVDRMGKMAYVKFLKNAPEV